HNRGFSDAYPAWFAFAAFASRGIGKSELAAEIALDAARFYRETGDHHSALARSAGLHAAGVGARLIRRLVHEEARLAATFLVAFASAVRHVGAIDGLALSAMLDWRILAVSVDRLLALVRA